MRHRNRLVATTVIVAALLASACSSSGASNHANGTTTPSTTTAGSASDATTTIAPSEAAATSGNTNGSTGSHVDATAATTAIGYLEKLIPPMHSAVTRTTYDAMLRTTCDATVSGAADHRSAAGTASAIVAGVPRGPSTVTQYQTGMLLLAETYLSLDHCDAPATYVASVVKALEPHASRALLDMTKHR